MDLLVANLAERPDLAPLIDRFPDAWPRFMTEQPLSALFYDVATTDYAAHCLVAVDRAAPNRPVARAYSVPFRPDPTGGLPADGHDAVIIQAARDRSAGRAGTVAAAVEITIAPAHRGAGLSHRMLAALRHNSARLGYPALVAPVRPTHVPADPGLPFAGYVALRRPDGLPEDPWLRVHVRAGGRVGPVAPTSMTLTGTLAQWRDWTGLPFDAPGPVRVPGALVPVHCDPARDYAVYVEPNVWVHHDLASSPTPAEPERAG